MFLFIRVPDTERAEGSRRFSFAMDGRKGKTPSLTSASLSANRRWRYEEEDSSFSSKSPLGDRGSKRHHIVRPVKPAACRRSYSRTVRELDLVFRQREFPFRAPGAPARGASAFRGTADAWQTAFGDLDTALSCSIIQSDPRQLLKVGT